MPVVNGLEERFGDQIDFFHLDIDQSITRDVRNQFGITGRTQYVLLDADGNVLKKWFGPLSFTEVSEYLEEYLGTLEGAAGS